MGLFDRWKNVPKKESQSKEITQHDEGEKITQSKEDTELITLAQLEKAYQDLSEDDKKKFHQTIGDSVDESVGAQESAEGTTENTQSIETTTEVTADSEDSNTVTTEPTAPVAEDTQPIIDTQATVPVSATTEEQSANNTINEEELISSILDKLFNATDEEYDRVFGKHHQRHMNEYVSNHKGEAIEEVPSHIKDNKRVESMVGDVWAG